MGIKYLFAVMDKQAALKFLRDLARALDLPLETLSVKNFPEMDKKKFFEYLQNDKKRTRDSLKLVLSEGPGKVFVQEVPFAEFKSRVNRHVDFED